MAAASKAAARREAPKKPAEGTGEWGGSGTLSSKKGNQAQSDQAQSMMDGEGTVGVEGGGRNGEAGGKSGKWRRERRKAAAAAAAAVVDDHGSDGGHEL